MENQQKINDLQEENLLSPLEADLTKATFVINSNPDNDAITINRPFLSKRNRLFPQILTTVITSWLSLIVGYASAYSSPAELSIIKDLNTTKDEISWITSFLPIGALVGSLAGGPLIEHIGRKKVLIITSFIFLVSWTINYFAQYYWNLYISRLLCGFGVGIASFTVPVYLAEVVQPKIRGRLGIFPTVLGNFGILICFFFGNIFRWQGLAAIGLLLTLPLLAFIWIIPETPRWYLSKAKMDKAKISLQWLRGDNYDISKEIDTLLHNIETRRKNSGRSKDKFFTKLHMKALSIVLALMFFQQFSGINALIFYMTEIFKELKSSIDESLCTAIVGVVNFFTTFIAVFLVDKLGRKILLFISCIVLAVMLFLLGTYFYLLNVLKVNLDQYEWIPLVIFILYFCAFSLGLGPVPWLMMGELLPAAVRGMAASICTASCFTFTFIITKLFPILDVSIGPHYIFWFFGATMVLSIAYLKFFVPETKKRTLEEIEMILSAH